MQLSRLGPISKLISGIFLFLIGIIITLLVTLYFKPINVNFLNNINESNNILENFKVESIGDVYLSFNKYSKKFELLIENIQTEEVYFPNILLGFDTRNFFLGKFKPTILKIFDAKINLDVENLFNSKSLEILPDNIFKNIFLKNLEEKSKLKKLFLNFKIIEINNSFISINGLYEEKINFEPVDLKIERNQNNFLISGYINQENNKKENSFASFFIKKNNKLYTSELNFENFNFNIPKKFLTKKINDFKLKISGKSKSSFSNDLNLIDTESDLYFDIKLKKNNLNDLVTNFQDGRVKSNYDELTGKIISDFIFNEGGSNFVINLITDRLLSTDRLSIGIDFIQLEKLMEYWPHNYKASAYNWVKENADGDIRDLLLAITFKKENYEVDEINGSFLFSEAKINYVDAMPKITNIKGSANISNDILYFKIDEGISRELEIIDGNVQIFDLDKPIENAKVEVDIYSNIEFITNYLELAPIDIPNSGRLKKLSGKPKFNLNLEFPLLLSLKMEEITYKANLSFTDETFDKLLDNYSLDKTNVIIDIDKNEVKYSGTAFFDAMPINFSGTEEIKNNFLHNNIEIDLRLDAFYLDDKFPEYFDSVKGFIPLKIFYNSNEEDNEYEIIGQGSINEFSMEASLFNINHNFEKGNLNFKMKALNDYNSETEVAIESDSFESFIKIFSNNEEVIEILVDRLISEDQNFSAIIKKEDKFYDIEVSGSKISLKETFNNRVHSEKSINAQFNFNVEKLNFKNKDIFNPNLSGLFLNNKFEELDFNFISNDVNHSVKIFEQDNFKKLIIESDYASDFLNFFDLNPKIEKGILRVDATEVDDIFRGKIFLDNFVAYETPLFARFLTLFSFEGLEQKLIDGGIFFDYLKADYSLDDNNNIKLDNGLIRGSELGLTFKGDFNSREEDFDISGTIIPAYTLNTLLTSLPIVGEIITAGAPEEGILAATFNMKNKDEKLDISINPISVLVPSLLRNFLKSE
ncbi:MAG: hypothetical protein CMN00_04225 [Rickettsiales bacterium]|nr:hypothetical protein [Rickettsiales bacterium]